jgi:hypothetical protein
MQAGKARAPSLEHEMLPLRPASGSHQERIDVESCGAMVSTLLCGQHLGEIAEIPDVNIVVFIHVRAGELLR